MNDVIHVLHFHSFHPLSRNEPPHHADGLGSEDQDEIGALHGFACEGAEAECRRRQCSRSSLRCRVLLLYIAMPVYSPSVDKKAFNVVNDIVTRLVQRTSTIRVAVAQSGNSCANYNAARATDVDMADILLGLRPIHAQLWW